MKNNRFEEKTKDIIKLAKQKGVIKSYETFCEENDSKSYSLLQEDIEYYSRLQKIETPKFQTGDIVFVSKYTYKSGLNGQKHIFVIIDNEQAIEITYFGFLLSSQISKASYKYNKVLKKNNQNRLNKDSIVKCDDLISISEVDIIFKIGEVSKSELEQFIDTYKRYLNSMS